MQLLKKNIHMNKVTDIAMTQITVDDDFIVPDVKPDVEKIIMEDAEIKIENVSCMDGKISVRGSLLFRLLYGSRDEEGLGNMKGAIVFDEKINCDNEDTSLGEDGLNVNCTIENMLIGIINTRKISVKAIVNMQITRDELYDIETAVDVDSQDIFTLKKKEKISQVACRKNDILRIKDEMELSGAKPNIGEILWKNVCISDISFRPLSGSIAVSGELRMFVVYKPVDTDVPYQWCESTFSFSGNVPMDGCSDDMIPDIDYKLCDVIVEVRNDYDGEPRIIALDAVLAMNVHMYRDDEIEYMADVYCLKKELTPITKSVDYSKILMKNMAKTKVNGRIICNNDSVGVLQICYSEGINRIKTKEIVENGVKVTGVVMVKIMCLTDNDNYPFTGMTSKIPYEYVIDVQDVTKETKCKLLAGPVPLQASMAGDGEIEVKGILTFDCLAFEKKEGMIIEEITEDETDKEKLKTMPGIIGHVVKEDESLWDIAKEYRSTIESIKEINDLKTDIVSPGSMLVVVKKM